MAKKFYIKPATRAAEHVNNGDDVDSLIAGFQARFQAESGSPTRPVAEPSTVAMPKTAASKAQGRCAGARSISGHCEPLYRSADAALAGLLDILCLASCAPACPCCRPPPRAHPRAQRGSRSLSSRFLSRRGTGSSHSFGGLRVSSRRALVRVMCLLPLGGTARRFHGDEV